MITGPISRSLRAKVTLAVVFPLVTILSTFTTIQYNQQREALLDDLSLLASLSGQVIEADLRQAMVESDFDQVQAVINAIGQSEEFRAVYLMDNSGEVIIAPDSDNVGLQLSNLEADCQPCHKLPVEERPRSVIVTTAEGERVFRSMRPLENSRECAECHGTGDQMRGLLLIDIHVETAEASIDSNLRKNLAWGAGTILITVLVVNVVLSHFVLNRLGRLNSSIKRFAQGIPSFVVPDLDDPTDHPDELGQLADSFGEMAQHVQAREADIRTLSESLRQHNIHRGRLLKRVISAQEEERKRVARELHDELGQSLSGLAFRAEAMGQLMASDTEQAFEKLEQIRSLTKTTMRRMYDLIWDLRPEALDDMGLAVAIRLYADRILTDTDIAFKMKADKAEDRLPPDIEITIYRICQEALHNAVRHSNASEVRTTLTRFDHRFVAEIIDNGQGFDPQTIEVEQSGRGLGLLGMNERALQLNGRLDISSKPGRGTHVRIQIPLPEGTNE